MSPWVRALAIIGGVVGLIYGILVAIQFAQLLYFYLIPGALGEIIIDVICGIIMCVLSVLILIAYGVISSSKKITVNWLILIVIGVAMLIFGGLPGILLVLAGIIDLIGILSD